MAGEGCTRSAWHRAHDGERNHPTTQPLETEIRAEWISSQSQFWARSLELTRFPKPFAARSICIGVPISRQRSQASLPVPSETTADRSLFLSTILVEG